MSLITKNIKKFFRILWTTFKVLYFIAVLVLLGVIGYIIYLLHPLYVDLKPTIPENFDSNDTISWTFYRYGKNPNVYQKLTVYQDGRNEVEITREMGDYDIEMLGTLMPWHPRRNKELELTMFSRKNVIPKEKASSLFNKAIKSGVLDIKDAEHINGATLIINVKIGLDEKSIVGPDFVGSAIAYPPEKWINLIYWQKLTQLLNTDKQIKPLMSKVKYLKPVPELMNSDTEEKQK